MTLFAHSRATVPMARHPDVVRARGLIGWLGLSIALSAVPCAAQQELIDKDNLSAGIATRALYERAPCGYRVTWVNWDSPFRAAGLRIGDLVVALNGAAVVCPPTESETVDAHARSQALQKFTQLGLGGQSESHTWEQLALRDAAELTLAVLRAAKDGSERLNIRGSVYHPRRYVSASNATLLDVNGPLASERDGFVRGWSAWYEDWRRFTERVLVDGWINRMDSRRMLAELREQDKRIALLERKYPSRFAQSVRADFEATRAVLDGEAVALSATDLEYRSLGEKRTAQVASAANQAWSEAQTALSAQIIPAFPSAHPLEARDKVAGKLVLLGPIKPQDWVMDTGRCFLTAGQQGQGFYFIDCEDPALERLYRAQRRYQRSVNAELKETHSFIARILDTPRMLMVGGRPAVGLMVTPLVANVSNAMVVDLRAEANGVSPFAGEDALISAKLAQPAADASPRLVLEAMIEAVKWGDEAMWRSLFADSEVWEENGRIGSAIRRYGPKLEEDWVKSRRQVLDSVFDVRVAQVSDPRVIVTPQMIKGAPTVEEVRVELRHIGRFDGAYRSFVNLNVNPVWRLQRRDQGPWRIVTDQSI